MTHSQPHSLAQTAPRGRASHSAILCGMKRSVQEIIELLVFALLALLVGTGLLWLVGQLFNIIGYVLVEIAEFIWFLLKYIIPAAVIVAAVYALVKLAQNGSRRSREVSPAGAAAVGAGPAVYSGSGSTSGARGSTLGESMTTAPQPTVTASPAPDTSPSDTPSTNASPAGAKSTPPRVEAVPAPDEDETASAEEASSDTKAKSSRSAAQASTKTEEDAQAVGSEQAEPGEGFQEMVEDEKDLPEDVQNKKGDKKNGKKGKS